MLRSKLQRQLQVESLENRMLCAANITASLMRGVLVVEGTSASDQITVRQANNRISIDGVKGTWNASQVTGIRVHAGGGNDVVSLQSVLKPTLVDGTGRLATMLTRQNQGRKKYHRVRPTSSNPSTSSVR